MIAQEMINAINYYADLVGKSVQVKRSDKTAYIKIIGIRCCKMVEKIVTIH